MSKIGLKIFDLNYRTQNYAQFKSRHNWLKNKQLDLLI